MSNHNFKHVKCHKLRRSILIEGTRLENYLGAISWKNILERSLGKYVVKLSWKYPVCLCREGLFDHYLENLL